MHCKLNILFVIIPEEKLLWNDIVHTYMQTVSICLHKWPEVTIIIFLTHIPHNLTLSCID